MCIRDRANPKQVMPFANIVLWLVMYRFRFISLLVSDTYTRACWTSFGRIGMPRCRCHAPEEFSHASAYLLHYRGVSAACDRSGVSQCCPGGHTSQRAGRPWAPGAQHHG